MCHTLLVSALPIAPEQNGTWTSPVTATVRLVTGGDGKRRWAWLRVALTALVGLIRETGLILAGLAAIDVAAFRAHEIAGWAVLGAGLLVLDLCRRGPASPPAGEP